MGRKNKLRVSSRLTLILQPFRRKSKDPYEGRRVAPLNLFFSTKWAEGSVQLSAVQSSISEGRWDDFHLGTHARTDHLFCKIQLQENTIPFVLQVHEIMSPWVHVVCWVCTTCPCGEAGPAQTPENFANFSTALLLALTPSFGATLV